jgi:hypothetical protein
MGFAGDIHNAMVAQEGSLFWQATADDPLRHWFERLSQGSATTGECRSYWSSHTPDTLARALEWVQKVPADFS